MQRSNIAKFQRLSIRAGKIADFELKFHDFYKEMPTQHKKIPQSVQNCFFFLASERASDTLFLVQIPAEYISVARLHEIERKQRVCKQNKDTREMQRLMKGIWFILKNKRSTTLGCYKEKTDLHLVKQIQAFIFIF